MTASLVLSFFFSSRRRHTRLQGDWSSDVCSSDLDTSSRLLADAGAIIAPTMILMAGADWVVKNRPTRKFFDALSSPVKQFRHYDDFYHAIFHESDRARPIADVRRFLVEAFERRSEPKSLLDADHAGFTRDEFDRLSAPLSPWCPRNCWF